MNRPIPAPDLHAVLPPRLCADIDYYAAAWSCGSSGADWERPFDKRDKATHRFTIADTRGPLSLTVPIVKPQSSRCLWSDIKVSDHGMWWDVHRVALESAYGRTPYFEFLIDSFLPFLTAGVTDRYPTLQSLCRAWDAGIRRCLGMEKDSVPCAASPHITRTRFPALPHPPYRQIRDSSLGFIPGLSVLDLIFNLGPEAQIYLHNLTSNLQHHNDT